MKKNVIKKRICVFLTIAVASLLCGCGVRNLFQVNIETGQEIPGGTQELPGEVDSSSTPEDDSDIAQDQEKVYIGEYLDYDNGDPNLEIAKGEDGKFIVQIGIFRLCSLDDGVGELSEEGMLFTATDPAGNPISGVITMEDDLAKVTFTDSTWTYLENGATYEYIKSSEALNIWGE